MKKRVTICLLKCISFLPFGLLYFFSDIIAFLLYHVIRYRRKLVRKNLIDSFPDKSVKEIKRIEKRYYRFVCDIMIETLKMLTISDKEMSKRAIVKNAEAVNESLSKNQPAVVLLGHYGNWEWVQEISRHFVESLKGSIYHPMTSKLWDDIYLEMRSRWGATLVPQDKAVRVLLDRNNIPWVFGFIADHRPRHTKDTSWTMFLNHETAFITGPEDIGKKVGASFFYLDIERISRGHYTMTFKKLDPTNSEEPYPYTKSYLRELEFSIKRDPALWLWSHKRWKYSRKP